MKLFLQNLVKDLNKFSKSLNKKSLIVDKPWALVDSDLEIQKLIFKKNKELIMSKDGKVTMGTWDYLPEARSIIINRGSDTILCNEGFLDEAVMILKLDGTKNNFYVLANENILPDLDVLKYLRELRWQYLNIESCKLTSGKYLEIISGEGKDEYGFAQDELNIGKKVLIELEEIEDGVYDTHTLNAFGQKIHKKFYVKNQRIENVVHDIEYKTRAGLTLVISQQKQSDYKKGDNEKLLQMGSIN
jgi:hypothetical protein